MLALSRYPGEGIVIGEGLAKIQVVDVRAGKKVRLGITAPRSLSVHRDEIYAAICVARTSPPDLALCLSYGNLPSHGVLHGNSFLPSTLLLQFKSDAAMQAAVEAGFAQFTPITPTHRSA